MQKAIPQEDAPAADELPRAFGRYQLVERIAHSPLTEVFKATSHGVEGFEKPVVIKRLRPAPAADERFVEAFLTEARQAVALSHANIVQVFDLGREGDAYFLAMEHVAGVDLARALRAARRAAAPLPLGLAVHLAAEIARALDYAHRRKDTAGHALNLVHRGVTPGNVLLSFEGEVKLGDFGMARGRDLLDPPTAANGRAAFAAPERLEGPAADARVDLYGLAATLHAALVGAAPADAPDARRAALAAACPDAPAELTGLLDKLLARDPADRLASAAQVYEELAAVLPRLGRRVGPNDLTDWLDRLRPHLDDPPGDVPELSAAAAPAEAVLDDELEAVDDAPEALELPSDRLTRPFDASAPPPPMPAPPLAQRDATLVALLVKAEAAVAEEALRPLVPAARRHGALVLEHAPPSLVLAFGVRRPDGRDTQRATALALKFHAAALKVATAQEPIATVSAGLHVTRVGVVADGSLDDDATLQEALAQVKSLATAARSRVLASDAVAAAGIDHFESVPVAEGAVALKGAVAPARRRVAGRKDLFRYFGELLAKAANEGAQVLEVVAGPGLGKTRFLEEVIYRLRKMGHPVSWHAAECLEHERDAPLSAVRAMLRTLLAIDELDADGAVREKARRLRDFGLTPDEMLAAGNVLGVVNSAPSAPSPAGSRGLRGALRKIFQGAVTSTVSVFAWDGVEHMDAASRTQFRDLLADTAARPILFVLSGRPGAWSGAAGRLRIQLAPLAPDDVATLVALRLGNRAPPRELVDDLAARCGGNPFCVEEQLKGYLLAGAVNLATDEVTFEPPPAAELPRTVRALVESHLATLDVPTQRVLRVAASRDATTRGALAGAAGLGAASLDAALAALLAAGLVAEEGQLVRVTDPTVRAALAAP